LFWKESAVAVCTGVEEEEGGGGRRRGRRKRKREEIKSMLAAY
jgi:hypothetical protein